MERLIDEWLPSFDESEFHSREIAAPPAVVEAAVRSLEAGDLRLTGLLMGIRTLPGSLPRPPPPRPADGDPDAPRETHGPPAHGSVGTAPRRGSVDGLRTARRAARRA